MSSLSIFAYQDWIKTRGTKTKICYWILLSLCIECCLSIAESVQELFINLSVIEREQVPEEGENLITYHPKSPTKKISHKWEINFVFKTT